MPGIALICSIGHNIRSGSKNPSITKNAGWISRGLFSTLSLGNGIGRTLLFIGTTFETEAILEILIHLVLLLIPEQLDDPLSRTMNREREP
jgi:hypothetical protein